MLSQKSSSELAAALPPWSYQFKKLVMDPHKSVRSVGQGQLGKSLGGEGGGGSLGKVVVGALRSW